MEILNFKFYEKKHCKFVLRSGKQVFGIVWEEQNAQTKKYFFSSVYQYMKAKLKNSEGLKNFAHPISIDDVIHAELMEQT